MKSNDVRRGTRAWRKLRKELLDREYRCVECGAITRLEPDHIVEVWEGGDSSPDNIQVLCRSCNMFKFHNRRRAARRGYSMEVGTDGMPVDPRHPCYATTRRYL